jgi:hypothetical protein
MWNRQQMWMANFHLCVVSSVTGSPVQASLVSNHVEFQDGLLLFLEQNLGLDPSLLSAHSLSPATVWILIHHDHPHLPQKKHNCLLPCLFGLSWQGTFVCFRQGRCLVTFCWEMDIEL